jgi:hypothetical protein
MELDGDNIKPALNVVDVGAWTEADGYGRITDFVVVGDIIYFQLFKANLALKSFNMITGEIVNFGVGISPGVMAISPDGDELHFDFGHTAICLTTHTIRDITPKNFAALFEQGYLFSMRHRTISDGVTFVSSSNSYISRIFYVNNYNYLTQMFSFDGFIIESINSVGNWIYFAAIPYGGEEVHLYRVHNDGYRLELVYQNIADVNGASSIILNVFFEDLILFKKSPTAHSIYALTRTPCTRDIVIKSVKKIVGCPLQKPTHDFSVLPPLCGGGNAVCN